MSADMLWAKEKFPSLSEQEQYRMVFDMLAWDIYHASSNLLSDKDNSKYKDLLKTKLDKFLKLDLEINGH